MRALIFVVVLIVLALIAALATGLLHVSPHGQGKAPQATDTRNGVTGSGGQPRAFDVETGTVQVGTRSATVKVPDIRVKPAAGAPSNDAAAAAGNHS